MIRVDGLGFGIRFSDEFVLDIDRPFDQVSSPGAGLFLSFSEMIDRSIDLLLAFGPCTLVAVFFPDQVVRTGLIVFRFLPCKTSPDLFLEP